jgi:hypothetical protein
MYAFYNVRLTYRTYIPIYLSALLLSHQRSSDLFFPSLMLRLHWAGETVRVL